MQANKLFWLGNFLIFVISAPGKFTLGNANQQLVTLNCTLSQYSTNSFIKPI